MTQDAFVQKMLAYMPAAACSISFNWLSNYPCKIRITKPRTSKLGDFRVSHGTAPMITINGNLNLFSFTVTFAHEMAHLVDYTKRKTLRDPHGATWKYEYSILLKELFVADVFPHELKPAIIKHINSPKAASCSDSALLEALKMYDTGESITLKQVPESGIFKLPNGRIFKKGELRRTRYRCTELASSRSYLVHMHSEVEILG